MKNDLFCEVCEITHLNGYMTEMTISLRLIHKILYFSQDVLRYKVWDINVLSLPNASGARQLSRL